MSETTDNAAGERKPWCLCMPGIGPHDDGCPAATPDADDAAGERHEVLSIEEETQWAVQWSPSWELVETGTKPPWVADYERWQNSADPVVYRRKVTTTVAASGWVEHSAGVR